MDDADPTVTNPDFYRTLWENGDVRVLEYRDTPGQMTTPHTHPNTVMITLTGFDRELSSGDQSREVTLAAGVALWLPAQSHSGRNIGTTATHTILVELKHSSTGTGSTVLGPDSGA
jgi:quercetin dioxygenase-like cupin family protein